MKKLQEGRSMIEMLGVLAIIGVLSIGGLAGYTMAMKRHKANQILDYVSRCAVIAQTSGKTTFANCGEVLPTSDKAPEGAAADYTISGISESGVKVTTPEISEDVADILAARGGAAGVTIAATGDGARAVEFTFSS